MPRLDSKADNVAKLRRMAREFTEVIMLWRTQTKLTSDAAP